MNNNVKKWKPVSLSSLAKKTKLTNKCLLVGDGKIMIFDKEPKSLFPSQQTLFIKCSVIIEGNKVIIDGQRVRYDFLIDDIYLRSFGEIREFLKEHSRKDLEAVKCRNKVKYYKNKSPWVVYKETVPATNVYFNKDIEIK